MRLIIILVITIMVTCSALPILANVYVVVYSTKNGKTGHAGVAIDNYHVVTSERGTDTVATGHLMYFDLWPSNDEFGFFNYSRNQDAQFYKLPNAIWSSPLSVESILSNGIPHREHYAPDGVFLIKTNYNQDIRIATELENIMSSQKYFNPRFYNCSDFVNDALKHVLGKKLRIKEFIPLTFTSTPNKLSRKLLARKEVIVLRRPDDMINHSFVRERVLKRDKVRNPFTI